MRRMVRVWALATRICSYGESTKFSNASTTSSTPDGSGCATQVEAGGRCASALRSMMTASRSVPDTPSTSAWWVLARMAQRPSSSPSTTQISHSGFRTIELLRHDAPDQLAQLALAARCGECRVPHVVLDVEVWVVDPNGSPQFERNRPDLLAIPGDEVELGIDHVDDVGEGRRRTLEDRDRCNVHVRHVVLEMEKRGVQGAQAVRTHPPSLHCRLVPRYYRPWPASPGQPAVVELRGSPSDAKKGVAWTRRRVSS